MPEETQETLLDRLQSFFNLNNSETDPIKTNQNLELSNVALSSLPATAGPNDPWTGQEDELGNRTYKAFDGSTYTLKLSDDQRTNLTKVQEDIIPAVKEYIKEPYLPTTDQVLDTGKAVASSVYDTASIPGDLVSGKKQLSDVTMGNIYEIASGSGAMSTLGKAPPNSLRMFGGVSMLGTETSRSFKKAKKLLKNSTKVNAEDLVGGAIDFNTNKKIWEETNWYVDPSDGQWRFYIDDTYSNLDSIKDIFKNNQITQAEIQGSKFREDTGLLTRLGDIFDHKELYKKYPTFKNISVDFYDNPLEKSAGKAGGGRIGINLANQKDMGTIRSTLLHEIQHIVQRKENFLQGSNPDSIPTELLDKRRAELEAEKKPFEITRDRLVNEFNATKRLFDERLKLSKEPLNGLTADQEFEISKLKVQDATGEFSGPSWTSIGKDYGVPPAQIQKAWGRQNNLNTLRKEVNKLEKEILDAIMDIDALDQESFDAEFQFYQGAGGEIESRLVGKMGETLTVPNAPTKFPIESRADMLRDEDNEVLINRRRYREREGVDPLTYTNEPRRNPPKDGSNSRQTFLDKLRGRKIKKEREKAGLGTKYNKGGSVNTMDNQMKMFEEGGIADDGMNRDPVSGNEVPSGSLAKEVRDDIPAQLSEGEYVVPADVVRYFGVRVFEEMRNEAKMGLQAMERDGRIGGEPVMSPVDQGTVSEEDLAQIEQMFTTGVANGGLMDKIAYVAANDPVINKSFNQGGAVVKFAVGGMAQSAYADPTQVDAVIGKFMQMAQEKPQIMEELAKRGIQVNRTSATEQPQQIQMSNSPAQTTEPITEGTIVPIKAAEGVLATPTMALPTGFQSNYAIPGASLTNTVPTITPAVAPVVEPAQPTSTAPAGVAYDPCASAGMVLDPVTNSCVLRSESGGDKDQNDFMNSMMTDASGTSEFRFKDPETNYFELSKEDFADLAKPANQKDKNKNDFERKALGLGLVIAGANPITALGALIYSGFQIKDQGQAISNLRAMALVAEARGFTAEAAALNTKAEEAIGTSSFGVKAANKLGVLNGVNNFFQQVAAFGSNVTLDESKYKGATLERAKDAYALANGGRSSIRAAAYASNFEKQRATAQANRAKKVNEADRIAEATAAAAASSAAQVAAYQAAQNNNNNDNGGNNDYVYTPGGGGGVSSAGDNTSGSGTGQGFIDRSTASTGNATGGLIARPKKKKKK